MPLKQNDFIEIEFTGKTEDGEIFDSNIKKDVEKANLKVPTKPFIYSLSQGMFLKGVDDFLIGKDIGKHKIELSPENAFGIRDLKLVQRVPMAVFKKQNVNPIPGATFNFDGRIAKVLTVSGGRVMIDFNHPMAGKQVIYEINILRKVDELKEKVNSFNEFLFKKPVKFEIEKDKITIEIENMMVQFANLFSEKYKELFNLELKVKELKEKPKEKKKEISKENKESQ